MDKGWITLDRQIMDHWTYSEKPFCKGLAWIDLILLADHTTHSALWRGKMVEFKRGDVNISISQLAERWGWSRDKVRRYLYQLERDNMVIVNTTTHKTTITLVKYGNFQNKRVTNKATNKSTDKTTDKSTDKSHLNNNKELNKECKRKNMPPAQSDSDDDEGMDPAEFLEKMRKGEIKFE